jgi:hypothetical protein
MHPDQEDLGMTPVTGFDQGLEITDNRVDGRSSQTIIPTELDDDDLGAVSLQ